MVFNIERGKAIRLGILGGILIALIVLYQIVFLPATIESILISQVKENTKGTLELKCTRASLFFGFEFKDVKLNTDLGPLFTADYLRLSINLLSLPIGHVGIRNLHLKNGNISIIGKDGEWNTSLSKSIAEGQSETQQEQQTESSGSRDEIEFFVPIKLYADINLENINFSIHETKNGKTNLTSVENIQARIALITNTFHQIPFNGKLAEIPETLIIQVGQNPIRIKATNIASGEAMTNLMVFKSGKEFYAKLIADTRNLLYKNRPIGAIADISLQYQPEKDILEVNAIRVQYRDEQWLKIAGSIKDLRSENPDISLSVTDSTIQLESLSTLLSSFGISLPPMRGVVTLSPLEVVGKANKAELRVGPTAKDILLTTARFRHSIPMLFINAEGIADLRGILGKDQENQKLLFGMFRELRIQPISAKYNGASVHLTAYGRERLDAQLSVTNFSLDPFTAPSAQGKVFADLKASSDGDFSEIDLNLNGKIRELRYAIDRSKSQINHASIGANAKLRFDPLDIDLKSINLSTVNYRGAPTINLIADGRSVMGRNDDHYYDIELLKINLENLYPTLPGSLQDSIVGMKDFLSKGPELKGKISYSTAGNNSNAKTNLVLKLPYLNINDLRISSNIGLNPTQIQLRDVSITGLRDALSAKVRGSLITKPEMKPNLSASIVLTKKQMFQIHPNIGLQGLVSFDAKVDSSKVSGNFLVRDLSFEFRSGDCSNVQLPRCRRFRADDVNLNLPVVHDLKIKNPLKLAEGSFAPNDLGFQGKPNFSIKSIYSSHNLRSEFQPTGFFFLGAPLPDKESGISASLQYRRNALFIDWLRAVIYRPKSRDGKHLWVADGRLDGSQIFFNLADLKPTNMEYSAKLQIKNLDLEPYLPASRSNYDGVISGDLDVRGRNLSDPIANTNASLSVHRISKEFTGFAMRILMPAEIIAWSVRNTVEISSMKAELKSGLVYSTIGIERGGIFPGAFIRPGGDEIRQDRIPLAQFLERARSEVNEFAERGTKNEP